MREKGRKRDLERERRQTKSVTERERKKGEADTEREREIASTAERGETHVRTKREVQ